MFTLLCLKKVLGGMNLIRRDIASQLFLIKLTEHKGWSSKNSFGTEGKCIFSVQDIDPKKPSIGSLMKRELLQ